MQEQNAKNVNVQKKENLSLTNDYFFKRVFSKEGNESILRDFLEAILQISIEKVEVKNPEIPKDMLDSKIGVLDLKVKINNGPIVEVEMQKVDKKNIDKRTATYLAKLYSMQLKSGEEYKKTSKVITVNILNFEFYNRNSYHCVAHMKFEPTQKDDYVDMGYSPEDEIAIEDFEVHFIELPKFIRKILSVKRKLDQWLWLLIGKGEKIEMAEKENEEIRKAQDEVEELSQSEQERYIYELRQKAIRDEKNIRDSGYEDGLEAGRKEMKQEIERLKEKAIRDEKNIRDSGYEDGLEAGIEAGRKEMKQEIERLKEKAINDERKTKLETAKKMLEKKISIEAIAEITGLTEVEIKDLKE